MADEVARSSGRYRLPAALAEKMAEAAQAEYESRLNAVELQERDETVGRRVAGAAACVLLDGCEVREEWGTRYYDLHPEDGLPMDVTWWSPRDDRREAEELADSKPWGFHARVIRRLTIITPVEPVVPPLVAPFVRLEGPPGEPGPDVVIIRNKNATKEKNDG